ncbi:leucine-rich repeat domain-containing protein [Bacillus sp. UNC41MFS5]|uniref:leucine-rich repeat domain-containing protein n=1 Tax=Bacillus sp. UNC41MFS5 TaxID=1449046 RepID=UPI000AEA6612|nr:leucine-rich repeat domain-containing protein [Bacillus sp. UNC41MFS5]
MKIQTEKGKVVLAVKDNINEQIKYINDHQITQLDITDSHYTGKDLNFLCECPTVDYITLDSRYLKDIAGLYYLKDLKGLSLTELTAAIGNKEIDLSRFPHLEFLSLYWSERIKGLSHLPNLKELSLWQYTPKLGNLQELTSFQSLKSLMITKSNVYSLRGIGSLQSLKELELSYLNRLTDLGDIEQLHSSLTRLEIDSCKKIVNLSPLQYLSSLETLFLLKCGDIPSIEFVQSLPHLKHFVFAKTNVVNGDVTPCFHIDYVYFDSKKHYSHKWKSFDHWVKQTR